MIDEVELLCITLGCECYIMNFIKLSIATPCLHFYNIVFAQVTTSASTLATKLLLLLLLLLLLFPLLSYYCATNKLVQGSGFSCVVELTTQLLRLINILWLPLCRINKFWWNTTLRDYCDHLYLWVITIWPKKAKKNGDKFWHPHRSDFLRRVSWPSALDGETYVITCKETVRWTIMIAIQWQWCCT
jgi:hypothetical protein